MDARTLVGKNVRRLRVLAGLSQEALGLSVGCEPSYIGRIERGRQNVTLDLLEQIARALGSKDMIPLFAAIEGDVPRGLRTGPKPRRPIKEIAPKQRTIVEAAASAPPVGDEGIEGA